MEEGNDMVIMLPKTIGTSSMETYAGDCVDTPLVYCPAVISAIATKGKNMQEHLRYSVI